MLARLLMLVSSWLVTGASIPLASSKPTTKSTESLADCPIVETQRDLNLTEYVAGGRWYVQQSMAVTYLPKADDFCVTTEYAFIDASHVTVAYLASCYCILPTCLLSQKAAQLGAGSAQYGPPRERQHADCSALGLACVHRCCRFLASLPPKHTE